MILIQNEKEKTVKDYFNKRIEYNDDFQKI
jgi:hypothetical protein